MRIARGIDLGQFFKLTTRSPHNIVITVFGRMGVIGEIILVMLCAAILRGSLQLLARESPGNWGLAVVPWVVIVSSCFGVVLEGPMGAVPFWILLGLMHAELRAVADESATGAGPIAPAPELAGPAPAAN